MWFVFLIGVLSITLAQDTRPITMSCVPETSSQMGAVGLPGKKGPRGEVGATGALGPPGLKGEPGESCRESCTLLQTELTQLRTVVHQLLPSSCKAAYKAGNTESGIYNIKKNGVVIQPFCDMETDGGGWTVFQRRLNGEQDFFLTWDKYRRGFGNKNREFWMGLNNLHFLTALGRFELRIELTNCENRTFYAKYRDFKVLGPDTNFRLQVSGFHGSPGITDSLARIHNGEEFSTKDRDHDNHPDAAYNCAVTWHGAWWYNVCHNSNLNGEYLPCNTSPRAMTWLNGTFQGFRHSEMKFRSL